LKGLLNTNTENGYTVLKVAAKNYNDLVTVVGIMPDTHVGSVLSLEGFWKIDAKYGRQFSVEKFEETLLGQPSISNAVGSVYSGKSNSFLMQALGAKRLIDNIFCKSSSGIAVSLKPLVVQRRVPAPKTLNRKARKDSKGGL